MVNCLEFYECRERGCYAADVGMGMFCPGVEARIADAAAPTTEESETR